jgi:hypothetical protein
LVLQTSRRIGTEPDIARTISLSELGFIAEQRGDPARWAGDLSRYMIDELGRAGACSRAVPAEDLPGRGPDRPQSASHRRT